MNLLNPASLVCIRLHTERLITQVAKANSESESEIYERILSRLKLHYGIDFSEVQKECGDESVLDLAELLNQLDKVYSFAYAEYLYLQSSRDYMTDCYESVT